MYKIFEFIGIGFIFGFLITALIKKLITIEIIKVYIPSFFHGIIDRLDKMLTGNDGCYSHTRFINVLWGIGSFCLICVTTLRGIIIPDPILVLMGTAMGLGMAQAIVNKKSEVTQALGMINKSITNTEEDKSNG